jgi:cardiolipin synthase A/B
MNVSHQISGNQLELLQSGTEFFPRLCSDIDAAHHSIYLETYIFAADQTGRVVADALQRAAARGVKVRLLLDGFGSAELPQQWVDDLREANVDVRWFRREISPFTLRRNRHRRLRRMHRKMAVMDGEVAFIGGINIINDIPAHTNLSAPQLDYAVRVKGPVAGEIRSATRYLWSVVSWANLSRRGKKIKWLVSGAKMPSTSQDIKIILRDNVRHRRDIEREYLNVIEGAQGEIIIANAYFLPGRSFRQALVNAARRGVRVTLLLQGRVEYWIQHYATLALYDELLGSGVEIYEYQASYLHAKVAVVDGLWATVGSSNIDPFSLLLAREANLAVLHTGFAGELRASLLAAIAEDAVHVGDGYNPTRNWLDRLFARFSYVMVRLMVGLSGYGKSI